MESPSNEPISAQGKTNTTLIIIGVIVALCCACLLIIAALGVVAYTRVTQTIQTSMPDFTFTLEPGTPTPEVVVTRPPVEDVSTGTLETLKNSIVPENDPYELACRLKGICNVPETLPPPAAPLETGAQQQFWITNSNTDEHFQIDATLKYITPHTYFWAEDGANVNMDDLKALMDTFENEIYPTDREFFGSEWTPGVDGDPHIYVVYAGNIGATVAGYFSSADSYNPLVHKYSNGHETYVLGTSQDLADNYTYSTLAHEFVHMIQFPTDRNDVSWINEGFAELGAFLNGYDVGGADWLYAQNPDLQLNDWADSNSPDFGPHYGISFLYVTYFLDRFGQDATKALTANPENDLTSVDDTLKTLDITDPATGKLITADDVFMDWAVAMFAQDKKVGDGRYAFHNYPDAPQTHATETISTCPANPFSRSVHQYGVDYISIDCPQQIAGGSNVKDSNLGLLAMAIAILCVIFLIALVCIILVGAIQKKKWGFYLGGGLLFVAILIGVILFNVANKATDNVKTEDSQSNYTLHFEGATVTGLLPVDAHSAAFSFWSNKGDESDMTLTRAFDLTNVSAPVSLSYWTWYDIEEDWDYVYLEVSEDGQNWQIVTTPSGTDTNPTGNSFGWGYTGKTSGWIQEEVDLSAYAGKQLQVRFEYVTDAAINGEGFLLDDVSVDAIGYASDFETDDGGWESAGFVRVENLLPQAFRLALILQGGGETTVQMIEVNADQTADIPLNLQPGETATLVITGATRFTREQANYSIEIK